MSEIGQDIQKASALLKQGQLVAIPTETVYGLAANALDTKAVVKIFEAKNRPFFDPLIIHVASVEDIELYCKNIPEIAYQLAAKFSPGPLTMLLDKKDVVPDLVTSGLPQVAVRIPKHELTLKLLKTVGLPLAAPSANPFGYISPTNVTHVEQQLGKKIQYILDGGNCEIGVESTIVGFEGDSIIVHRIGGLAIEELETFGKKVELRINHSSNPQAPGQLKSHYAPRKPLFVGDIDELIKQHSGKKISVLSFYNTYSVYTKQLSSKKDLHEAAHNLFSYLRELDASDTEIILAEKFPNTFLGRAINDRLERAATK
ncbi:MAG: L-threonylcarbamoyladenylate synthase [Bacteroidota bacterium]|nr:L-threonylcarbamoyladenylate synthase [Bacteroidota bacterium]